MEEIKEIFDEPETPMNPREYEFEYDSQEESESDCDSAYEKCLFQELTFDESFRYLDELKNDIKRMQDRYDEYHIIFTTKFIDNPFYKVKNKLV